MSTDSRPWYERVRRWGQTNLTEDDPKRNNIDFWVEQWRRTRVQGVIVNCGGIVTYYKTDFKEQYLAAGLGDRDYFKAFMDAAQSLGLVVIARMDTNRATKEFYEAHPNWFCRDKDNNPVIRQGRYVACVNSGYFREYLPAIITEIIEKYRPASFAENSWSGLGKDNICYCDNCREMFLEATGYGLPEEVNWDDPVYREWVRWNYKRRTENWDFLNEITNRVGGKDCFYCGMIHADPTNPGRRFVDIKELCKRSKIIFTDHQSRDPLNGFEQSYVNGLLLRFASNEETVVPQSTAYYVRGDRTFRLSATPPNEPNLWMISGGAGGISPWFHHVSGAEYDRRQFEHPIPYYNWHADNEEYLYNRTSLANVGIVWNQTNADFYGRDDVYERVSLPWSGYISALIQWRIPFIPINAADIGKYSHRIKTLVLPDVAILSDSQIDDICAFIEGGGNIVITGITGTLDGDGLPAKASKLWEMLNIEFTGETEGEFRSQPSDWEYPHAHTYIHLPEERHEIFEGFEETEIIGFGGGLHIVDSHGPLKPISGYIMPFPIFPPEFSWIREVRDDMSTILAGKLASGSRVVYFPADIDRCYGRERLPDHGRLLANAVSWAAGDSFTLEVESKGLIIVHPYKQEDRLLLHLVNLSGSNLNPGYCTDIFPIEQVKVKMPIDIHIERVRLLAGKKEIPFELDDGHAQFTIDRIDEFELVVLEGK
jgi:hypothetical protein